MVMFSPAFHWESNPGQIFRGSALCKLFFEINKVALGAILPSCLVPELRKRFSPVTELRTFGVLIFFCFLFQGICMPDLVEIGLSVLKL
jgi:hypothetical protein